MKGDLTPIVMLKYQETSSTSFLRRDAFTLLNAAPRWQSLNEKAWDKLEHMVDEMMKHVSDNYVYIYTGSRQGGE